MKLLYILFISFFFIVLVSYLSHNMGIPLGNIMLPREIALEDLEPSVTRQSSPVKFVIRDTTLIATTERDRAQKVNLQYYIIIGSSKNLMQTQKKAEKLKNDFNTHIIVLPVTKEGYYRISYGEYSSLEQAKTTIKSIKTLVTSDAWIFSTIN